MVKIGGLKLKQGKEKGQYLAESSSTKGKFYTVDAEKGTCECAHWKFRLARTGGKCKHLLAAEKIYKPSKKTKKEIEKQKHIIKYVKEHQPVGTINLINKFGDEVDELIEKGDLIEELGKIRIME